MARRPKQRSSAHDDLFGSGAEQFENKPGAHATKEIEIIQPPAAESEEQAFERKLREMDERRALKKQRAGSCGSCEHSRVWETEPNADPNHRWVRCIQQLPWHSYRPPGNPCEFQPSRWVARKTVDVKS